MKTTLSKFQQIFQVPKLASICKTQKCLYLENRARESNFDEIFDPLLSSLPSFQKNFVLPKMAAILNFYFFKLHFMSDEQIIVTLFGGYIYIF